MQMVRPRVLESEMMEKRWLCHLMVSSFCIFFLALSFFNTDLSFTTSNPLFSNSAPAPPATANNKTVLGRPFIDSRRISTTRKVHHRTHDSAVARRKKVPRLAYLVSGSKGDLDRLWRTLRALYHPRNLYIVHLDLDSPAEERRELASRVANDAMFAGGGNVHIAGRSDMVSYRGPTMVAHTLHACALFLKKSKDWDWFINLSASDYPLMTQDDILYTFSMLPRNLNFVEHTSRLGWKEEQRAKPLIIDPGLYSSKKSEIFWATQKRASPTAFKLFTGSAWMALSREFVEYCVWGWDNLPRTLLMYYANFISSSEGYFQTVICNVPKFARTVVNHDLHYIKWDSPPDQHPHSLTSADKSSMVGSNAPFARKFRRNETVLDEIDDELLGRTDHGGFVPGGWCAGGSTPKCSGVGNPARLKPGPGALRFAELMDGLIRSGKYRKNQCR